MKQASKLNQYQQHKSSSFYKCDI